MGEPGASPPRRACRGRNEQSRGFLEAGRGCQLLARALEADLKLQDPVRNSGNLAGTPGTASAPSASVSRGQVCSNAEEIYKK